MNESHFCEDGHPERRMARDHAGLSQGRNVRKLGGREVIWSSLSRSLVTQLALLQAVV